MRKYPHILAGIGAVIITVSIISLSSAVPSTPTYNPTNITQELTYEEWLNSPSYDAVKRELSTITYTNGVSVTNKLYAYPYAIVFVDEINKTNVWVEPPDWMLDYRHHDPRYVVKARTKLNGEYVLVEMRVYSDQGFFEGEVLRERETK